jgi:diguanylate cyclase (GGDEF)-like protein/PAS domain S-box-containing protein
MLRRALAACAIVLVALGAHWAGVLKPVNYALSAFRMYSEPRAPTGDIVIVDIDAKSIAAIGSWPWPRRLHAELIDRLSAMGVAEIAFDVDFSSASNETDDAIFADAIKRAAGKVTLAAFVQKRTTGKNSEIAFNRPIDRFAKNAWIGGVNVRPDSDGMVRRFGYGLILDGKTVASIPAILAGGVGSAGREFTIDYSIDVLSIDRISLIDVLRGQVDPARVAGKKVIVGAQALELRDFFTVPVAGTISGAMVQAAATETLLQNRVLRPSSLWVEIVGLILIALATFFIGRIRWTTILAGIAAASLGIELTALLIQREGGGVVLSASWQCALIVFAVAVLVSEIDLRQLLQTMWRLRANNAEALLSKVVADNFAGVVVVDDAGVIRTASRSASDLIGRQLVGSRAQDVLPPELTTAVDAALAVPSSGRRVWHPNVVQVRPKGEERDFEYVTTVSEFEDAAENGGANKKRRVVSLTFTDVTEQRKAEARLAYLARFDTLTGLPNRNQLVERLDDVFTSARTSVRASAVVYVDVDAFKQVNDALGHQTADRVLKVVAERAAGLLPHGAMIARLGGDEFAAVISGENAGDDAVTYARRVIAAIEQPLMIDGHRVLITASAGVAPADARDKGPDDILKRADVALYRAKAAGGACVTVFERGMLQALVDRQRMENDLWRSLERNQIEVRYQPQVDLNTNRITGVEALLRWNHPKRGVVAPTDFIPVAEATGFIDELGRWVLETACAEVVHLPEPVRLSVNVSSAQFNRSDMAAVIAAALQKSGLSPHRLDIEITESLFLQPAKSVQTTLAAIRALGVSIALDDFGTGYSSLSYIQRLPISKIKLDKSFVAGLPENAGSAAIVRAVAGLARDLDLQLNAEGVETTAQAAFLKSMGVDEVQGYLYGRAQTAADVAEMVRPLTRPRLRSA